MFGRDGVKLHEPAVASLLLRIGLAICFVYAAVAALRQPDAWIGYVPAFAAQLFDAGTLLVIVSIGELVLALWLVSGKYLRYAATIAALLLITIVVFNPNAFIVTFRDIGLIFMALALLLIDI